ETHLLPDCSSPAVFQVENGTQFIHCMFPRRLHVVWEGKEIETELPYGIVSYFGTHGDAFYFAAERKVNSLE
ncbi:hypothetical protein PENTCL1PPCAC_8314, partial [Pristionchus entomophagus]